MIELHTSQLIAPFYVPQLNDVMTHGHTEYVNAGGRGSCKSSFVATSIILLMLSNHNYNALICRKVSNTLRDSVYNEIKKVIARMGLDYIFTYSLTPLQITIKRTGQSIYFRGADDPLKIKSITVPHGYIAIQWYEETAEFTMNDIITIKMSAMRGGDNYWVFYSYNPPSSTRAWVNTEFRKPRNDRTYNESTYLDVPRSWLGDAFLTEAEELKKSNDRAYRNIFLGEATGTGKNVFENIEIRTIGQDELNTLDYHYYGLDWGYYPDYFRFIACAYNHKERILYIYKELSLQKNNNLQAYSKLIEFLKENKISENVRITCDSAEPKSIADFRDYGLNCRGAIKGVGSRDASFKWLQGLKKIVIDPNCRYACDEFSLYEYAIDKRTGDIIDGYPDGQPDHSIDAVRYSIEEVWRRKGA